MKLRMNEKCGDMMEYIIGDEEREYLSHYNQKDYDCPSVATDIAVFTVGETQVESIRHLPEKKLRLLLIKRGGYPYKGSWALPGGFCKKDEDVWETARRELCEETGIQDAYLNLSGIYGEVNRDPRGWIISHAFLALMDGAKCCLRADSDAWDAKWFDVSVSEKCLEKQYENKSVQISKLYVIKLISGSITLEAEVCEKKLFCNNHEQTFYSITKSVGLAFDHARIILDAFKKLQNAAKYDEKIIFDLMPERFTLTELQNVFELVLGCELLKSNFRRKISEFVVETDQITCGRGHRHARQFERNVEKFLQ